MPLQVLALAPGIAARQMSITHTACMLAAVLEGKRTQQSYRGCRKAVKCADPSAEDCSVLCDVCPGSCVCGATRKSREMSGEDVLWEGKQGAITPLQREVYLVCRRGLSLARQVEVSELGPQ